MVAIAIAPMYCSLPICPTIAKSTIPNKGTVIVVIMLGMASRRICLFKVIKHLQ